ncbi:hypothetical protein JCM17823_05780 [Halorubrum gandharaense]
MKRRYTLLLVIAFTLAVGVTMTSAPGLANPADDGGFTAGEPDLSLTLAENEVTPGETASLEVAVSNDGNLDTGAQGDRVLNARSVTAEISDGEPFESASGEVAVGEIPDGTTMDAPLSIDVPSDIEPGEYDVEIDLSYAYTARVSDSSNFQNRRTTTETEEVTVVVPEDARFDVGNVSTDVEPGASGEATVEVKNVGVEDANATRATILGGGGVTVDGGESEVALGNLESGETVAVDLEVAVDDAASDSAKPLDFEFSYDGKNGITREAPAESASLAPADSQSFSVEVVEETLAVGYDGIVRGEVVNDGPRTVDDGVVVMEPMSESLFVEDTRYALPTIESGETAEFAYPTDVSGQADPGDRQVQFTVEYFDDEGTPLEDGPAADRVSINDQVDEFSLEGNATVEQGGSEEVTLSITNERDETFTDISALLYTDSPLSAPNDEAYVPEIGPGETADLTFEVAAGAGATTELHPIELDFEYDTERGDTELSDAYQHPVQVETAETDDDDGVGLLGIVGVFLLLGATGVVVWHWRIRD